MIMSILLAAALGGVQPAAAPIAAPPLPPVSPPPHGATRARAVGPLSRLISPDDYPPAALRNGEEGVVAFRLTVGSDGRVTGCGITTSSGSANLDAATCSILRRRARFHPATDGKGGRLVDHFSSRVRWTIPKSPQLSVANSQSRFVIRLGANRNVVECRFEIPSSLAGQPGSPCPVTGEIAGTLIKSIPASIPLTGRDLVLETHMIVGSGDLGKDIGSGVGQTLLRRDRVMLAIDAAGKPTSCDEDGEGLIEPVSHSTGCAAMAEVAFLPVPPEATDRAERRLTIVRALYLRPVTPPR